MQGTAAAPTVTLEGSPGHDEPAHQVAGLGRLVSWFESRGGSVSKVKLETLGGNMGLSLVTSEVVARGDVVMSIPISLCMTVQSVSCFGFWFGRKRHVLFAVSVCVCLSVSLSLCLPFSRVRYVCLSACLSAPLLPIFADEYTVPDRLPRSY